LITGLLVAIAKQSVDIQVGLLDQIGGLQCQRRYPAAVQSENNDEVEQRMADFERDHLALFQARPQDMLGGSLNTSDENAVSCHAARKHHRRLVWAEFCLEGNLLEPVHIQNR
jgi:hypothetical protein